MAGDFVRHRRSRRPGHTCRDLRDDRANRCGRAARPPPYPGSHTPGMGRWSWPVETAGMTWLVEWLVGCQRRSGGAMTPRMAHVMSTRHCFACGGVWPVIPGSAGEWHGPVSPWQPTTQCERWLPVSAIPSDALMSRQGLLGSGSASRLVSFSARCSALVRVRRW